MPLTEKLQNVIPLASILAVQQRTGVETLLLTVIVTVVLTIAFKVGFHMTPLLRIVNFPRLFETIDCKYEALEVLFTTV